MSANPLLFVVLSCVKDVINKTLNIPDSLLKLIKS